MKNWIKVNANNIDTAVKRCYVAPIMDWILTVNLLNVYIMGIYHNGLFVSLKMEEE